jgi:hypothetical protein
MSPILSSHPRPRQLVTTGSNIGEAQGATVALLCATILGVSYLPRRNAQPNEAPTTENTHKSTEKKKSTKKGKSLA